MKISEIVFALRKGETDFGTLIGGPCEFAQIEKATITEETAFVLPLGDTATDNDQDNSANQRVIEKFGVACALKNVVAEDLEESASILIYDRVHIVRSQILKMLINFDMGYESTVEYIGYKVLDINSAWLWVQFEFKLESRIIAGQDGFGIIQERVVDERQDPAQLPGLNKMYSEYILAPDENLPYVGQLPAGDFGIPVDAAQQTDTDDDPNPGGFNSRGFATGFRILLTNALGR